MQNTTKTIIIEEAIRTMAQFGIVLFLIWPAVDLLITQSTTFMLLFFCAPLVYFPFGCGSGYAVGRVFNSRVGLRGSL